MRAKRKRPWILNLWIVGAVLVSLAAFLLHSRNWTRLRPDRLQLISGVYFLDIPYKELDTVSWKAQIPQMERDHGFSFWAREKGVFIDSIHPARPVYVFVDELRHPKLELRYRDSLLVYLNFADSLETRAMYEYLMGKLAEAGSP